VVSVCPNNRFADQANAFICEPQPTRSFYPTVRLTGFFQADAASFNQELANQIAVGGGDPAAGDLQDGVDFRRARLAAVGEAWDNVSYTLEIDFAFPGHPSFMDVWLEIENVVGQFSLQIGQYRQPFGMDGLTSVKELTFLERALPFTFLPFRQIGAMLYGHAHAEQTPGPSVTFLGAYAYTAYLLTGETRSYNNTSGSFGRVVPHHSVGKQGGIGIWEFAGRWSYLDLNDANIFWRTLERFDRRFELVPQPANEIPIQLHSRNTGQSD